MADETSTSDDTNSSSDNQSSNSNFGGSGKKYVVGIDTGGADDQGYMETVAKGIQECGNEAVTTQVGPNQESYMAGKGADVGVFLCNGVAPATMWSFVNAIKAGSVPYTIFAIEGWYCTDPNGPISSLEKVREVSFEPEWDAGQFMDSGAVAQMQADAGGATTIGEWADANSEYFSICYAKTPEEMAQNICSGSCGGGGSGTSMNSSGGVQIKDKTFEKCIRRICAATDSVFLVENNAAVLFPYTDWLAFTLKEKIQTITPKEIDPSVFSMEYNTQGFYNKVTVAWGDAELPERFPNNPLMHEKYVKQQEEKQTETTQTTTKKTSTTQTITADKNGGTVISEQYDALVEKYGVLEKRVQSTAPDLETAQYLVNALLIQYVRDFNHECQCRALGNRKYLGGTFYLVTNPFTKEQEMLYLNGYTVRMQKKHPMYFDLDFRYGPESAEELLDLQTITGTGTSSGDSGTMGGEAASINELAKLAIGNETDPLKKATKVHDYLKQFIVYAYYECSKEEWGKDPEKIWQAIKSGQGTNCADTANLTRAVMSAAGLNAVVVHGPNHFWTVVTINGKEYASDLTANSGNHSRRNLGEVYDNLSYDSKCGKTASC